MTDEEKELYSDALEYLAHVKYDKKHTITRFLLIKHWDNELFTTPQFPRLSNTVNADYNWINKYLYIDEVLYCKLYKIE